MENINSILKKALYGLIKPCPCCGGTDVYHKVINKDTEKEATDKTVSLGEKVGCHTCGLNMTRKTGCNIINQWNSRVPIIEK